MSRKAFHLCLSGRVVRRSIVVSLIVGTVLIMINQGGAILEGDWPPIWKMALTYIVPFGVSTYGAYTACVAHIGPDDMAGDND